MAKKILNQKYFFGGIAPSEKIGGMGSYYFGKGLNIFDEPSNMSILPAASKVSGSTVTDLVKWIVSGSPYDTNKYFYSEGGKIYKETSGGSWSTLRTIANSSGQGLEIHDDYLYYTQDTQIGRYGPLSGSPSFDDDWQTGLNDTSTTNFAPIKAFKEGLAVGHGNYVGWWDGSVWNDDILVLPPGLQIRSLDVIDEFLVIGTWRGTAITDNEEGYVFFWDGSSTTFNYFVSIPEGGCNAITNTKNRLFSIWGSSGNLFINYNPLQKIQQLPKMTMNTYMEVFPGAITNWKNLTCIGVSANTDNTSLEQGIYIWGAKDDTYQEVLNFGFPISTGTTTGTTLKIGAVKGLGNNLYVGWRDDTTYGVDKITNSASPQSSATWESLIFDDEKPYKIKQALAIKVTHHALASGESIQIGYKVDRASSYTTMTANSTVGDTETVFKLNKRFKEFQWEVILATTGSTSPTVTSTTFEFLDGEEEGEISG